LSQSRERERATLGSPRRQTMSGHADSDSPTAIENRLAQIEKRLARVEGKLNFGISIIIALSVLTLIKLFWPA
jgi:hypothetical protein